MIVDVAFGIHAKDAIKDAIEAGYSSVMFDGQVFPSRKILRETKRICRDTPHARGIDLRTRDIGGTKKGSPCPRKKIEIAPNPNDAVTFVRNEC